MTKPKCQKCQGELKKHFPLVNTRVWECKKCGMVQKVKKRLDSGWEYL